MFWHRELEAVQSGEGAAAMIGTGVIVLLCLLAVSGMINLLCLFFTCKWSPGLRLFPIIGMPIALPVCFLPIGMAAFFFEFLF